MSWRQMGKASPSGCDLCCEYTEKDPPDQLSLMVLPKLEAE